VKFNDTTTNQGIIQEIDFLCNTDSSSYSTPDKTRNINRWQHIVVAEILDSMDEWDFQGNKAYSDLTANKWDYSWPTEILKIKRVEVDYDDDGKYVVAKPIDSSTYGGTIATSAEINNIFSEGEPYYDAYGDKLYLYPVPDTAVNSGLIVWYTKNVNEFTAMDTSWPTNMVGNSGEPAFAEPFHRILSLGASLDYAKKHQLNELYLFEKLRKFYSTRAADKILSLKTRYYSENYK